MSLGQKLQTVVIYVPPTLDGLIAREEAEHPIPVKEVAEVPPSPPEEVEDSEKESEDSGSGEGDNTDPDDPSALSAHPPDEEAPPISAAEELMTEEKGTELPGSKEEHPNPFVTEVILEDGPYELVNYLMRATLRPEVGKEYDTGKAFTLPVDPILFEVISFDGRILWEDTHSGYEGESTGPRNLGIERGIDMGKKVTLRVTGAGGRVIVGYRRA